jgi:hypothetical protein
MSVAVHAGGGLVVLLLPVLLSIYKPRGRTRFGQGKEEGGDAAGGPQLAAASRFSSQ